MAEASGVRRSWLTAASSAVRIRSASASGRGLGGLLGEAFLAQRDGGLGGERLHDAAVGGGQRAAAQHQGEVVVDGHVDVALAGRPAGRVADGGGDLPRGRVLLPLRAAAGVRAALQQGDRVRPKVSRSRSSSAVSGRAPRSTLPATVARVAASAQARAASRVRRAARSTTALTATATTTNTIRARTFSRSAIVEGVERRGEEVVQQQRTRRRRRAAPATCPPTSATATTAARNSRMSLVSDSSLAQQVQQRRSAAAARAAASAKPASRRRRDSAAGAGQHRAPAALPDLLVGDQVHVDRAGQGGGGDPDARRRRSGRAGRAGWRRARAGWR